MATFTGTVAADGSAELHSDLFTAGRPDTGKYTIKLRNSPFTQAPAVVVTANIEDTGNRLRVATVAGITKDGFNLVIRDADNDRNNTAFSFVMSDDNGSGGN
jgi:hypothetical protein